MLYFEILLASMSSEEEKNTAEYIFEQCGNMMFHIAFDYVKHDASAEDVEKMMRISPAWWRGIPEMRR